MSTKCYNCSSELAIEAGMSIPRSEDCHSCHAQLRCCKMCEFYDSKAYNECREPSADRIVEKEKANFCDYFKVGSKDNSNSNNNNIMAAADALFKK